MAILFMSSTTLYTKNTQHTHRYAWVKYSQKMLPRISQKFHLLCFSVFLLCLHCVPKLVALVYSPLEDVLIAFWYDVLIVLEVHQLKQQVIHLFCMTYQNLLYLVLFVDFHSRLDLMMDSVTVVL